ncbi:MAG: ATP-binding protein [Prevotellaceae bacterium]|nr:ATP-binding protein [Prevotellaceae bacterium]
MIELDSPLAQIVIGVRRSGKSTLCHKVLRQQNVRYAYVNFDDERLYKLKAEELNTVLEALYMVYGDFKYLFLDEVQNIEEWFLFVNRLLRQNIRLLVTGSNAKLLGSELSTHLTGRYNQIELYPFSFSEYCQFKKVDARDISTRGIAFKKAAFEEYMYKGGFPELFWVKNSRNYIQNLLDAIIRRDIQQRFKVRYIESLRSMANHLIDNFGQELNYTDLAERFGFGSDHTAENYVSYLKQAYLLVCIHKFSFKSKERIRSEKAYVIDPAFIGERVETVVGTNPGWRLENIVYIELLRTRPLFEDVFYFRNNRYEIDFVVCRNNTVKELIQVSLDVSSQKTFKREISALQKGAVELKCDNLTLIALNGADRVAADVPQIRVLSAIDWLLEES